MVKLGVGAADGHVSDSHRKAAIWKLPDLVLGVPAVAAVYYNAYGELAQQRERLCISLIFVSHTGNTHGVMTTTTLQ